MAWWRAGSRAIVCGPPARASTTSTSAQGARSDGPVSRRVLSAPDTQGRDGWSGVELPNLFKECGLLDVQIRPCAHRFTEGPRGRAAAREDRFTFVHTLMIVRGTVP